jgi:hypothetical protein
MRRQLSHLTILAVALAVCFILPSAASAATFTINDLTDTVSVSDTNGSGRLLGVSCNGEGCFFSIFGLQGPTGFFTVTYNGIQVFELDMLEPGSGLVSDIISLSDFNSTSTFWNFLSEAENALQGGNGVPTLLEDGTSQATLVIHYFNAQEGDEGMDVINILSDISDPAPSVPEPASGLTAFIGLGTLGGFWFRRRATRVS